MATTRETVPDLDTRPADNGAHVEGTDAPDITRVSGWSRLNNPYHAARAQIRARAAERPARPEGLAGLIIAFFEVLCLCERVIPAAHRIELGEYVADPDDEVIHNLDESDGEFDSFPGDAELERTSAPFVADPDSILVGASAMQSTDDDQDVPGAVLSAPASETIVSIPTTPEQREEVAAALVSFHRDMLVPKVAPFILNPGAPPVGPEAPVLRTPPDGKGGK